MSYEDKSAIELLLNENWEMRKSLKMDRLCCTLNYFLVISKPCMTVC